MLTATLSRQTSSVQKKEEMLLFQKSYSSTHQEETDDSFFHEAFSSAFTKTNLVKIVAKNSVHLKPVLSTPLSIGGERESKEELLTHPSANKGVDSSILSQALNRIQQIEKDQILYQAISHHPFFKESSTSPTGKIIEMQKLIEIALQDKNMQALLILVKILLCEKESDNIILCDYMRKLYTVDLPAPLIPSLDLSKPIILEIPKFEIHNLKCSITLTNIHNETSSARLAPQINYGSSEILVPVDSRESAIIVACNCNLNSGKYYYEMKLLKISTECPDIPMRIGWLSEEGLINPSTAVPTNGRRTSSWMDFAEVTNSVLPLTLLGDGVNAIVYDGDNGQICNNGKELPYELTNVAKWKEGDVIGVTANIVKSTFSFSINGTSLGDIKTGSRYYPALCLSPGSHVSLNFGNPASNVLSDPEIKSVSSETTSSCLNFTAGQNYITFENLTSLPNNLLDGEFTIDTLIQFSFPDNCGEQIILSIGGDDCGFELTIQDNYSFSYQVFPEKSKFVSPPIPLDALTNWSQLSISKRRNGTYDLYLNAYKIPMSMESFLSTTLPSGSNGGIVDKLMFGHSNRPSTTSSGKRKFRGKLCQLAVWSIQFDLKNQNESIFGRMKIASLSSIPNYLISYWSCNEGTGTALYNAINCIINGNIHGGNVIWEDIPIPHDILIPSLISIPEKSLHLPFKADNIAHAFGFSSHSQILSSKLNDGTINSISSEKAVVGLLVAMERVASSELAVVESYMGKQIPVSLTFPTSLAGIGIGLNVRNFLLLHSISRQLLDNISPSNNLEIDKEFFKATVSIDGALAALSCLRLINSNLQVLMHSKVSIASVGLGSVTMKSETSLVAEDSFVSRLFKLLHSYSVLDPPSSDGVHSSILNLVIQEAASIIINGFEIFCPTHSSRHTLILKLFEEDKNSALLNGLVKKISESSKLLTMYFHHELICRWSFNDNDFPKKPLRDILANKSFSPKWTLSEVKDFDETIEISKDNVNLPTKDNILKFICSIASPEWYKAAVAKYGILTHYLKSGLVDLYSDFINQYDSKEMEKSLLLLLDFLRLLFNCIEKQNVNSPAAALLAFSLQSFWICFVSDEISSSFSKSDCPLLEFIADHIKQRDSKSEVADASEKSIFLTETPSSFVPLNTLTFDADRCNRKIALSNGDTEASLRRKGNWSTVISREGFPSFSGIYTFEILIKKVSKKLMLCIGLSDRSKFSGQLGINKYGCGWQLNGDLFLRGGVIRHGYGLGVGSVENIKLSIIYDSNEGKMSCRNISTGEFYGVAFTGLHERGAVDLYPAVSFHEIKDCVSLLGYSHTPGSQKVSLRQIRNLSLSNSSLAPEFFTYCQLLMEHCTKILSSHTLDEAKQHNSLKILLPATLSVVSLCNNIAPIYSTKLLPIVNNLAKSLSEILKSNADLINASIFSELLLLASYFGGKLSALLVFGSSDVTPSNEESNVDVSSIISTDTSNRLGDITQIDEKTESNNLIQWCSSPLISGGFRLLNENSLESGLEPLPAFIINVINGNNSFLELSKWILRHAGGSSNAIKAGGITIDKAMNAVLATLLFHTGSYTLATSSVQAISLANKNKSSEDESIGITASDIRPAGILIEIWKGISNLRQWIWQEQSLGKISYEALATHVIQKADLLLSLSPCIKQTDADNREAQEENLRLKNFFLKSSSSISVTPSGPQAQENKLSVVAQICKFIKDMLVNASKLKDLLLVSRKRAILRIEGFLQVQNLISSVLSHNSALSARAAVLLHFLSNNTNSPSSNWHYKDNLNGCGTSLLNSLQISYFNFYSTLASMLRTISPLQSYDVTIVLLKSFIITVLPVDHNFLVQFKVFVFMQSIMQSLRDGKDHLGEDSVGKEIISDDKITFRNASRMVRVCLKVVIFLAQQVAEAEFESEASPSFMDPSPLAPVALKRSLSGPDTLSRSVFVILFVELQEAVKFPSSSIPVLEEITFLLSAVGSSKVCQKFLATSDWFSLLLSVLKCGHMYIMKRIMKLFRQVMPRYNVNSFKVQIPNFENESSDRMSCDAMQLIKFFMDIIGTTALPISDVSFFNPQCSQEYFFSLSTESISLLLALIRDDESWREVILKALLPHLSGETVEESENHYKEQQGQAAALAILGGHFEKLQSGGSCFVMPNYNSPMYPMNQQIPSGRALIVSMSKENGDVEIIPEGLTFSVGSKKTFSISSNFLCPIPEIIFDPSVLPNSFKQTLLKNFQKLCSSLQIKFASEVASVKKNDLPIKTEVIKESKIEVDPLAKSDIASLSLPSMELESLRYLKILSLLFNTNDFSVSDEVVLLMKGDSQLFSSLMYLSSLNVTSNGISDIEILEGILQSHLLVFKKSFEPNLSTFFEHDRTDSVLSLEDGEMDATDEERDLIDNKIHRDVCGAVCKKCKLLKWPICAEHKCLLTVHDNYPTPKCHIANCNQTFAEVKCHVCDVVCTLYDWSLTPPEALFLKQCHPSERESLMHTILYCSYCNGIGFPGYGNVLTERGEGPNQECLRIPEKTELPLATWAASFEHVNGCQAVRGIPIGIGVLVVKGDSDILVSAMNKTPASKRENTRGSFDMGGNESYKKKALDIASQIGCPNHWALRAVEDSGGDYEQALSWLLSNGDLLAREDAEKEFSPFPRSLIKKMKTGDSISLESKETPAPTALVNSNSLEDFEAFVSKMHTKNIYIASSLKGTYQEWRDDWTLIPSNSMALSLKFKAAISSLDAYNISVLLTPSKSDNAIGKGIQFILKNEEDSDYSSSSSTGNGRISVGSSNGLKMFKKGLSKKKNASTSIIKENTTASSHDRYHQHRNLTPNSLYSFWCVVTLQGFLVVGKGDDIGKNIITYTQCEELGFDFTKTNVYVSFSSGSKETVYVDVNIHSLENFDVISCIDDRMEEGESPHPFPPITRYFNANEETRDIWLFNILQSYKFSKDSLFDAKKYPNSPELVLKSIQSICNILITLHARRIINSFYQKNNASVSSLMMWNDELFSKYSEQDIKNHIGLLRITFNRLGVPSSRCCMNGETSLAKQAYHERESYNNIVLSALRSKTCNLFITSIINCIENHVIRCVIMSSSCAIDDEVSNFYSSGRRNLSFFEVEDDSARLFDSDIPKSADLPFAEWLTSLLLNSEPSLQVKKKLINIWSVALKASSVLIKEGAFKILIIILNNALEESGSKSDSENVTPFPWSDYLSFIPRDRIHNLAICEVDKEMEDHPIYSRYVQAIVACSAALKTIEKKISTFLDNINEKKNESEKKEACLYFNGGCSYVLIDTPTDLRSPWTAEYYLKRESEEGILSFSSNTHIYLSADKIFYRRQDKDDIIFDAKIPLNEWTHIAFVSSTAQISLALFVNGVCIQSVKHQAYLPLGTLGARRNSFKGFLREVRFRRVALSELQIKNQMNLSMELTPSQFSDVVFHGYWPCNQIHNNIVVDDISKSFSPSITYNTCIKKTVSPPFILIDENVGENVGENKNEEIWQRACVCGEENLIFSGVLSRKENAELWGIWSKSASQALSLAIDPLSIKEGGGKKKDSSLFSGILTYSQTNTVMQVEGRRDSKSISFQVTHTYPGGSYNPFSTLENLSFSGGIKSDGIRGSWSAKTTCTRPPTFLPSPLFAHNKLHHEQISLSENGTELSCLPKSGLEENSNPPSSALCVFGEKNVDSDSPSTLLGGKRVFEFSILDCNLLSEGEGAVINLGVASPSAPLNKVIGSDELGFSYQSDGHFYHGSSLKTYGPDSGFGKNDIIGVELDMDEGRLSFLKNDLDLGVACESVFGPSKLKGGLLPALSFGSNNERVKLIGLKNGFAVRTFFSDSIQKRWSCVYKDGQPHGFGILSNNDGSSLRGEWVKGCKQGIFMNQSSSNNVTYEMYFNDSKTKPPSSKEISKFKDKEKERQSVRDSSKAAWKNKSTTLKLVGKLWYIDKGSSQSDNGNGSDICCLIQIYKGLVRGGYKIRYPEDPDWDSDPGGTIKGTCEDQMLKISTFRDGDRKTFLSGSFSPNTGETEAKSFELTGLNGNGTAVKWNLSLVEKSHSPTTPKLAPLPEPTSLTKTHSNPEIIIQKDFLPSLLSTLTVPLKPDESLAIEDEEEDEEAALARALEMSMANETYEEKKEETKLKTKVEEEVKTFDLVKVETIENESAKPNISIEEETKESSTDREEKSESFSSPVGASTSNLPPGHWSCEVCTYVNGIDSNTCEICFTNRGSAPSAPNTSRLSETDDDRGLLETLSLYREVQHSLERSVERSDINFQELVNSAAMDLSRLDHSSSSLLSVLGSRDGLRQFLRRSRQASHPKTGNVTAEGVFSDKALMMLAETVENDSEVILGVKIEKENKFEPDTKKIENLEEESKEESKICTIDGSFDIRSRLFVFDSINKGHQIQLSDDFCKATYSASHVKSMVLGTKGFSSGVHYWEIKIEAATEFGSLCIGVTEKGKRFDMWGDYGFISYRTSSTYDEEKIYGKFYEAGNTIGVLLDMDKGLLSFIRDGEDNILNRVAAVNMGVSHTHLRRSDRGGRGIRASGKCLFPFVGFQRHKDSVSIKDGKWLSSKSIPAQQLVDDLIVSMSLLESWSAPSPPLSLNPSFLDSCFQLWKQIQSGIKFYKSRAGFPVLINPSKESCEKATGKKTLQGGVRVRTSRGDAKILGTHRGRLWYMCDNEDVCWYLSDTEIASLKSTTKELKEWACKICTILNGATLKRCFMCGNPCEDDDEGIDEEKEIFISEETSTSEELKLEVSLDSFTSLLLGENEWGRERDEELVRAINILSDRHSIDPGHLNLDSLVAPDDTFEIFSIFKKEFIFARFVLLLNFNKYISTILPLIDFSECISNTVSEELIELESSSRNLPLRLSTLRSILFTRFKLAYWKNVVNASIQETTPPLDEFEKPNEIPTIVVNRIQANKDRLMNLNEKDREQQSVFGQVMRVMSSWESNQFRRSYADVQDAGQERAFYVKFESEGVDDHGGPYQAIFPICANDEPCGPLSLFSLCPNASDNDLGGGINKDKVLPALPLSLKKVDQFRFLGKLIGLATRHKVKVGLNLPSLIWKPLVGLSPNLEDLKLVDKTKADEIQRLETFKDSDIIHYEAEDLLEALLRLLPVGTGYSFGIDPEKGVYGVQISSNQKLFLSNQAERKKIIKSAISFQLSFKYEAAIRALFAGLAVVLPVEMFSLFTITEIDNLICGRPEIDIDLLKKVTEYEGVKPDEPHIMIFWEVLEEMQQEEKEKFIEFVSARSRLPTSADEFPTSFKIQTANVKSGVDPDSMLPHSQTCFFSLALPKYTTKEICRNKLVLAIFNSPTMDADFVQRNVTGWENLS